MTDEEFLQELQETFQNGGLSLAGRGISDDDLPLVLSIPGMKRLSVADNYDLTDRWLDECPKPTDVVLLELEGVPITDVGLEKVPYYFPDLVVISLKRTRTTFDGILRILPNCRQLSVIYHGGIDATSENENRFYEVFNFSPPGFFKETER